MDKTKHIAFFDSGVGGLTVFHAARRTLPGESFIYYADQSNVPYGEKSRSDIICFTRESLEYLLNQFELKAFVIACNTATSAAAANLRKTYSFPIIGMEPAVKPALKVAKGKKVLVLATSLTLAEEKFRSLLISLDAIGRVERLALPGLVDLAEQGILGGPPVDEYLRATFDGVNFDSYGSVVLGCTHFHYFRRKIESLCRLQVVDGNEGTVNHLRSSIVQGEWGAQPVFLSSINREVDWDFSLWLNHLEKGNIDGIDNSANVHEGL